MKPGSKDHRHKLLISGDELRELKKHTSRMVEAFGLDRKIEDYQGTRPLTLYRWDLDCLLSVIDLALKDERHYPDKSAPQYQAMQRLGERLHQEYDAVYGNEAIPTLGKTWTKGSSKSLSCKAPGQREMHEERVAVLDESPRLKLGKSATFFVKSQLLRLQQKQDTWEADFLPLAPAPSKRAKLWIGMVIRHNDDYVMAKLTVQEPPTVNHLANLLAHAMRRPLVEFAHRPRILHLRCRPQWDELLPHLKQVGIEVVSQKYLPKWDEAFQEFSADEPAFAKRKAP